MKKYNISISQYYKSMWFVVYKTGTRSIHYCLEKHVNPDLQWPCSHTVSPVEEEQPINTDVFQRYFTWAFTRNPWDRLVSCFVDKTKKVIGTPWEHAAYSKYKNHTFKEFINDIQDDDITQCDVHHCLQTCLIPPGIEFCGRFEDLQEDFNFVRDKIGIPQQQLPHKNKSKHKHYTKYYDEETKQIVAEKYAEDIEMFGYGFGE